jgi:hypothetical protein
MTLTEKIMSALVGKTFTQFYEGKEIARGHILAMIGTNAVMFVVTEVSGEEFDEIHSVTEIGYDRIRKTGYRFSPDNPLREQIAG